MKILITGGTGFLGRATALRLAKRDHTVSILGRNIEIGRQLQDDGIRFFRADLSQKNEVAKACAGQDMVVHSAALASPWGPYEKFYEANVVGTQNVLAGCLQHKVKRIVNISTPSIYFDYQHRLNIKESDPLPVRQFTHYGATKLLADREVERAREMGLESISLRPRAIFGPGDQNILGRMMRAAQSGVLPLVGGGTSYFDMTYIDNVVDAIVLCLYAPSQLSGRVFNITNGEPIQAQELMRKLSSKLDLNVRLQTIPYFAAHGIATLIEVAYKIMRISTEPPVSKYSIGLMSKSQTLDISAARRDLAYEPNVSLDEGLDRYCSWWKDAQNKTGHAIVG